MKVAEKKVTVSAFCEDYSLKAYKFWYADKKFEFVPKSQVNFIENSHGESSFGEGIESRYFEMPLWLFKKLQGVQYYGV